MNDDNTSFTKEEIKIEEQKIYDQLRAAKCVIALEGLSDDALDGGWSYTGVKSYINILEDELKSQKQQTHNGYRCMTRHKHANLIHLWAEGAEIQFNSVENPDDIGWMDCEKTPLWHSENLKFRRKPKEPNWWENIPEHGVLCWVSDIDESVEKMLFLIIGVDDDDDIYRFKSIQSAWKYATPLTNEEIERFKR